MSYILAVNPMILSTTGMDKAGVFTATAIASAIATILLAFMAKLPFAQAPSMGLNAFFAFTLCQGMGFTWMSVGGCCPLCPRYLLVLLTLFATSKGFLRVVNSLDLFIRQHICIDGGGFERLVSHQFLGSLNVMPLSPPVTRHGSKSLLAKRDSLASTIGPFSALFL